MTRRKSAIHDFRFSEQFLGQAELLALLLERMQKGWPVPVVPQRSTTGFGSLKPPA